MEQYRRGDLTFVVLDVFQAGDTAGFDFYGYAMPLSDLSALRKG